MIRLLLLTKLFNDDEGVSEYCKSIAGYMTSFGHDAAITAFEDHSPYTIDDHLTGLTVERVSFPYDGKTMYDWVMMLNNELERCGRELNEHGSFDIVHANDWSTIPSGTLLSALWGIPLVVTIHSTENERGCNGKHAGLISELEWRGCYEADRVLVTNEGTKNSVLFDLDVPGEKVMTVDPYTENWTERVEQVYKEEIGDKT